MLQIVEITAYDPAAETTETLRYATQAYITRPADTPASTLYEPRMLEEIDISEGLFSAEALAVGGEAQPDYGALRLANNGDLDRLDQLSIAGREVVVYELSSPTAAYSSKTLVFRGTCERPSVREGEVVVSLRDRRRELDQPLQTSTYGGWNGAIDIATSSLYGSVGGGSGAPAALCPTGAMTLEVVLNIDSTALLSGGGHLLGWDGATGWQLSFGASGYAVPPSTVSTFGIYFDFYDTTGAAHRWMISGWTVGRYQKLAIVRAADGTVSCYVNGQAATAFKFPGGPAIGTPSAATGTFRIGSSVSSIGAGGVVRIAEAAIFNVARAADDVGETAVGELTGTETGLVWYCKFNETTGTTASDDAGSNDAAMSSSSVWIDSLEGGADLAGTLKPIALGYAENVKPVLVTPTHSTGLVYQIHDVEFGGALQAVTAVYDNGDPLTLTTNYTVDLAAGTITLLASPAGVVTCDVQGPPANEDVPGLLELVAVTEGPLSAANTSERNALRTLQPAQVGWFFGGGDTSPSYRDAMNQICGGLGIWWRINGSGELSMGRWDEPAGSPVGTWERAELQQVELLDVPEPAWSVAIGYQRNWTVQTESEVAGVVSEERRQYLARDYRYATRQDAAVLTAYPLATQESRTTCLRNRADAEAEAARQLALFGRARRAVRASRSLADSPTVPGLAECWALDYPRFDLPGGALGRVLGRRRQGSPRQIEIALWCGLPGHLRVTTDGDYRVTTDGDSRRTA